VKTVAPCDLRSGARTTAPREGQGEVMDTNWWTRRLICEPTGRTEAAEEAVAPNLPNWKIGGSCSEVNTEEEG
jgi:hypothetical protein